MACDDVNGTQHCTAVEKWYCESVGCAENGYAPEVLEELCDAFRTAVFVILALIDERRVRYVRFSREPANDRRTTKMNDRRSTVIRTALRNVRLG